MFSNKICNVENCHSSLYTHTTLASVTEIETYLEERIQGSQLMVFKNLLVCVKSTMSTCRKQAILLHMCRPTVCERISHHRCRRGRPESVVALQKFMRGE